MLARMGSFNVALLGALLSAGVSPERAREVVDLFDRSVDERYGLHAQVLATKRDVAEINASLGREIAQTQAEIAQTRAEIAQTRAEIAQTRAELKRDIAQLETRLSKDIAVTRVELTRWMLAALTAQTALLLGALKLT